jgi:hypothetical protein
MPKPEGKGIRERIVVVVGFPLLSFRIRLQFE